jgi:hypothetical protein
VELDERHEVPMESPGCAAGARSIFGSRQLPSDQRWAGAGFEVRAVLTFGERGQTVFGGWGEKAVRMNNMRHSNSGVGRGICQAKLTSATWNNATWGRIVAAWNGRLSSARPTGRTNHQAHN